LNDTGHYLGHCQSENNQIGAIHWLVELLKLNADVADKVTKSDVVHPDVLISTIVICEMYFEDQSSET